MGATRKGGKVTIAELPYLSALTSNHNLRRAGGIHRHIWTMRNIERMRRQIKSIGGMFDWRREVITCYPECYKLYDFAPCRGRSITSHRELGLERRENPFLNRSRGVDTQVLRR